MKNKHSCLLFIALAVSITSFSQQKDSAGTKNKPDSVVQSIYTCAMHPGIKSYKPGKCPDCGVELRERKIKLKVKSYYTCGMHPDVISEEPGRCPRCGMGLIEKKYTDSVQQKKDMR